MAVKCTIGKRHKWAWVKDKVVTSGGPSQYRISQRGIYRCECGARKYGEPKLEMSEVAP